MQTAPADRRGRDLAQLHHAASPIGDLDAQHVTALAYRAARLRRGVHDRVRDEFRHEERRGRNKFATTRAFDRSSTNVRACATLAIDASRSTAGSAGASRFGGASKPSRSRGSRSESQSAASAAISEATTTVVSGHAARIRASASRPDRRRSPSPRTTASARSRAATSTARRPSLASPATSKPSTASSAPRTARRASSGPSATTTRTGAPADACSVTARSSRRSAANWRTLRDRARASHSPRSVAGGNT
jgi:hypothetical protein